MRKTEEELLSELRECYEKHGKINRKIFNEDDEFSSGKTVYNHFGGFSQALEEAELPHHNKPQKKDKVEIECLNCGSRREVYPYRAEKEFQNGVSETCKKCMKKEVKKSCDWCGDEIIKKQYVVENHENFFCDKNCLGKWRSENIVGEEHPRWKESTDNYGRNWSKIREKVIQRDNESCEDCGIEREEHYEKYGTDIHVHHIKPRREFLEEGKGIEDANEMNNLVTLCSSCHKIREWS